METASITTQNTKYATKRTETETLSSPLSRAETRRLGDAHAISLIEEGLKGEYINEEDFLKFLRQ